MKYWIGVFAGDKPLSLLSNMDMNAAAGLSCSLPSMFLLDSRLIAFSVEPALVRQVFSWLQRNQQLEDDNQDIILDPNPMTFLDKAMVALSEQICEGACRTWKKECSLESDDGQEFGKPGDFRKVDEESEVERF